MSKLSSIRHIVAWLLPYWRKHWLHACINASMGICSVLLGLGFVAGTRLATDVATGHEQGYTLNEAIAILAVILLVQISLGVVSRWVAAILGVRAQNAMQETMFRDILGADWMSLRRLHSGDVMNRLLRDVGVLVTLLTSEIPSLLTTIFQFTAAFLYLYFIDKRLAIILVIIAPFFLLVSKLYVRRLRRITHDIREKESKVQSIIQESLQHSLVIKTLHRVPYVVERLTRTHLALRKGIANKTVYSSFSATLMNIGFSTGYMVTFAWGAYQLQQHAITYGAMIAFIQLVGQIQGPIRSLSQYVPIFVNASTACERLMELDDMPHEQIEKVYETPQSTPLGIEFCEVSYAYPDSKKQVVQHFSYSFAPGSITAILGETGTGKTTLVRLLLALMPPQSGRVELVDGQGHRTSISPSVRPLIAYVPQGNTLLSGTIRENMLLGNPEATDEMMHAALLDAAADFVLTLPEGLDTHCTESGGGLSEGQAQRVCIARALLRDAPILLFDESTSSLDAQTETRVIENIVNHHRGKTMLFITHRPKVLEYCTQRLDLSQSMATE